MRRVIFQPVVWILDVALQYVGAALDAATDLFDLDGED